MQSDEVATILKRLITNSALPQVYVLDNGEVITISDEMLAYEVLKSFDDTKIAEIISFFEDSLASEVSKKLAVPEY
jgi:predicted transcriptional regulator